MTEFAKGIIVKSDLKLLYEAKVDFDADLSKYGIEKGVLTNPDEGEVFAPVAMWLEAIDLVLQRLKEQGADFSKIKGISGAGMQHGTVFWSKDAETLLVGSMQKRPCSNSYKAERKTRERELSVTHLALIGRMRVRRNSVTSLM